MWGGGAILKTVFCILYPFGGVLFCVPFLRYNLEDL